MFILIFRFITVSMVAFLSVSARAQSGTSATIATGVLAIVGGTIGTNSKDADPPTQLAFSVIQSLGVVAVGRGITTRYKRDVMDEINGVLGASPNDTLRNDLKNRIADVKFNNAKVDRVSLTAQLSTLALTNGVAAYSNRDRVKEVRNIYMFVSISALLGAVATALSEPERPQVTNTDQRVSKFVVHWKTPTEVAVWF